MPVELINPAELPKPEQYVQVGVAAGSRLVLVSGQVARTLDGQPVGPGDLAAQTEQALLNLRTAPAAGAGFGDVARLMIDAVDWTEAELADLGAGVGRAAQPLGVSPVRPTTLIGVAALSEPDLLIEVEAVAVLP